MTGARPDTGPGVPGAHAHFLRVRWDAEAQNSDDLPQARGSQARCQLSFTDAARTLQRAPLGQRRRASRSREHPEGHPALPPPGARRTAGHLGAAPLPRARGGRWHARTRGAGETGGSHWKGRERKHEQASVRPWEPLGLQGQRQRHRRAGATPRAPEGRRPSHPARRSPSPHAAQQRLPATRRPQAAAPLSCPDPKARPFHQDPRGHTLRHLPRAPHA